MEKVSCTKLNKFQQVASVLEEGAVSARKIARENEIELKTSIRIDRDSIEGKHILTYLTIVEMPDDESEYFVPITKGD